MRVAVIPSTVGVSRVRGETLMGTKLFMLNWGYFVSPVDRLDESRSAAVFLLNESYGCGSHNKLFTLEIIYE